MWHDTTKNCFIIIIIITISFTLFVSINSANINFELTNKQSCRQRKFLNNRVSTKNPETFVSVFIYFFIVKFLFKSQLKLEEFNCFS